MDRSVAPKISAHGEVFGETVGVAGRAGARLGGDLLPIGEGLRGWYIGPRLGLWWLSEAAGTTTALGLGAAAGRRMIAGSGLTLQAGLGLTHTVVLAGDSSFGRTSIPTIELRVGHARARKGGAR